MRFAPAFMMLALATPALTQTRQSGPAPGAAPAGLVPCPARALPVEAYVGDIELESLVGCNADFAGPWSVAYAPGGEYVYVSMFSSGFAAANCLVGKLDAGTLDIVSSFSVGMSPEEFAFSKTPTGRMKYGFVTNSSSSSVSVFDANDQIVTTIDIPFDPAYSFQTAFPFGIVMSPGGTRAFVGTLDGSGDIHVIDTINLVLLPLETMHFGQGHGAGRLAFSGSTLVVPLTEYDPAFAGSTAKVGFVDPADPANASTVTLLSAFDVGLYPSPQDVAFGCGTQAYIAGFDMGADVWVLDVPTRRLLRTIPTFTSQPEGKFQGIGSTDDGFLAVADFLSGEIAVIDTWTDSWVSTTDHGQFGLHRQFMEMTFRPDGRELLVPCLTSENLALLRVR